MIVIWCGSGEEENTLISGYFTLPSDVELTLLALEEIQIVTGPFQREESQIAEELHQP